MVPVHELVASETMLLLKPSAAFWCKFVLRYLPVISVVS